MKKILSLFAGILLSTSTTTNVVSCEKPNEAKSFDTANILKQCRSAIIKKLKDKNQLIPSDFGNLTSDNLQNSNGFLQVEETMQQIILNSANIENNTSYFVYDIENKNKLNYIYGDIVPVISVKVNEKISNNPFIGNSSISLDAQYFSNFNTTTEFEADQHYFEDNVKQELTNNDNGNLSDESSETFLLTHDLLLNLKDNNEDFNLDYDRLLRSNDFKIKSITFVENGKSFTFEYQISGSINKPGTALIFEKSN